MKKVIISQPFAGLDPDEVKETRQNIVEYLEGKGYEIIDTFFSGGWYSEESMKERGVVNVPLCFLQGFIEAMSRANTVCFAANWDQYRGCQLEHDIAEEYGLEILYAPY